MIATVRTMLKLTRAAGTLVVVLFLVSIFTPVSSLLGYWTSVPPGVAPADAIVVLGAGGPTPPGILDGPSLRKALYGIRLYRRGLARFLVLSGSPDDGSQRGEVSLRMELARELGIPAEAIVAETSGLTDNDTTTRGEVVHVQKMVAGISIRTVLLVTDSQHMRRARYLFEEVGFSVLPAPIDEILLDASSPEERLKLMRWIGQEWFARLYYAAAR
jgi:uncharacterized SAM-binding protein YcdF (DUF218 family)